MNRNPSATPLATRLAVQPIAAIRAAQEADAYFKAGPLPATKPAPNLSALDLMYAYYSD